MNCMSVCDLGFVCLFVCLNFLSFDFLIFLGFNFIMKVKAKTEVVVGDPKEKICEVVDKLHADLLVMGSRGFGPIKR